LKTSRNEVLVYTTLWKKTKMLPKRYYEAELETNQRTQTSEADVWPDNNKHNNNNNNNNNHNHTFVDHRSAVASEALHIVVNFRGIGDTAERFS